MRVECSAEDHCRARFERGQMTRGFQAIDSGHDDVEQYQVRRVFGAGMQRGMAIAGFGDDRNPGMLG